MTAMILAPAAGKYVPVLTQDKARTYTNKIVTASPQHYFIFFKIFLQRSTRVARTRQKSRLEADADRK